MPLLLYLFRRWNHQPNQDDLAAARATIGGLSQHLSRQADNIARLETQLAAANLAYESQRFQLQSCRRHCDSLAAQLGNEAQRVIELEAEAALWLTRQIQRRPVSEN